MFLLSLPSECVINEVINKMRYWTCVIMMFLLVACKENQPKNTVESKQKPTIIEDRVVEAIETTDTLQLDLTLQNKVFKVYAKKSGLIAETELSHFGTQKIDTSALILAIDNKEEFLKLKEQKNMLLTRLKEKANAINTELHEDLNYFITILKPNTLLPEIDSDKFSEKFISWFKAQDTYKYYVKAREIENGMEDFFYLNETPVYITSFYVKKGAFVKKGDLLYEYITDFDLIYSGVIWPDNLPIKKVMSAKQNKEIKYTLNKGKISVQRKLANDVDKTLPVKVVLQKFA